MKTSTIRRHTPNAANRDCGTPQRRHTETAAHRNGRERCAVLKQKDLSQQFRCAAVSVCSSFGVPPFPFATFRREVSI